MKLIGIAGTNGSGKDTVSQYLADRGWLFISASGDLLIPELKRRGLPLERQEMADLSAQWRRELGMGAIIDKAVEEFKKRGGEGLAVSSLRHPGEADRIHELGGRVVWVDADPKIRYERIYQRGQGDKDKKSFEQFLAEEQAEQKHTGDQATLSVEDVKSRADIFIENNQNDLEKFREIVAKALKI